MKRKQLKFLAGSVGIILAITYLAFSGFQESKAYYVTVSELYDSRGTSSEKRVKVTGDVIPGSIRRQGRNLNFVIRQLDEKTNELQTVAVRYIGIDAPPDTFVDNAQAIVEGRLGEDDAFIATSMTVECSVPNSHC